MCASGVGADLSNKDGVSEKSDGGLKTLVTKFSIF